MRILFHHLRVAILFSCNKQTKENTLPLYWPEFSGRTGMNFEDSEENYSPPHKAPKGAPKYCAYHVRRCCV